MWNAFGHSPTVARLFQLALGPLKPPFTEMSRTKWLLFRKKYFKKGNRKIWKRAGLLWCDSSLCSADLTQTANTHFQALCRKVSHIVTTAHGSAVVVFQRDGGAAGSQRLLRRNNASFLTRVHPKETCANAGRAVAQVCQLACQLKSRSRDFAYFGTI